MDDYWREIVCLAILLVFSGTCSAAETALTSMTKLRIKNLEEKLGKKAEILNFWLEEPNSILTLVLLLNNMVNIAASTISADIALKHAQTLNISHDTALAISVGLVTFTVLVLGEISPKTVAKEHAEQLSLRVLPVLKGLLKLLWPLIWLLTVLSKLVMRMVGIRPSREGFALSEMELKNLISVGEREGLIEEQEHDMLHSIFRFRDTEVKEIMTPRIEMTVLNSLEKGQDIYHAVIGCGFSRLPVYENTIDNIVGMLYAKDLLKCKDRDQLILSDLLRHPIFVPEHLLINDLFRLFKKEKTHIGIVVDEYGGTAGLVTIEDVIEEIVGEIQDEYDIDEELQCEVRSDGTIIVDARMNIHEANEKLGLDLPEDGDFETLAGLVISCLGEVPDEDAQLSIADCRIQVLSSSERKLNTISITKIEPEEVKNNDED